MLKSVTKLLLFVVIILSSIIYFIIGLRSELDNSPVVVKSANQDEYNHLINYLENGGMIFVSRENFNVIINSYPQLIEYPYIDIESKLDTRDYRYTPYIKTVDNLFNIDGNRAVYILRKDLSQVEFLKLGKDLYLKGYRVESNYLKFLLISVLSLTALIITISIGSKIRSLSLLSFIPLILLFSNFNLALYLSIVLIIVAFVILYETFKLYNRYIVSNNIGLFRSCLILFIALLPVTVSFLVVDGTNDLGLEDLSYESMEKIYSEDIPNVSNLFSNYAFQSKVLYDVTYCFPIYNSSVNINEFKSAHNSLELVNVEVLSFREEFLATFKNYLAGTKEGELYLTSTGANDPFHIDKKEYMQICILAVIMLISLLLLQKKYK